MKTCSKIQREKTMDIKVFKKNGKDFVMVRNDQPVKTSDGSRGKIVAVWKPHQGARTRIQVFFPGQEEFEHFWIDDLELVE